MLSFLTLSIPCLKDLDYFYHAHRSEVTGQDYSQVLDQNKIKTTSRPIVILSTLWLTRQKIGCSPPLFATHTTFFACSSPLSSPDLASASELIHLHYP